MRPKNNPDGITISPHDGCFFEKWQPRHHRRVCWCTSGQAQRHSSITITETLAPFGSFKRCLDLAIDLAIHAMPTRSITVSLSFWWRDWQGSSWLNQTPRMSKRPVQQWNYLSRFILTWPHFLIKWKSRAIRALSGYLSCKLWIAEQPSPSGQICATLNLEIHAHAT